MAFPAPTKILDPLVESWAREAGLRTEELSSIIGGDFIGGAIGVPLDLFLTTLGSKIASLAIGVAGILFGTYSLKGQGRMQTDTIHISSRVLTEFLDPSPQDIRDIQKQVGDVVDGLLAGRIDKVAYALIRSPREFQGLIPSGAPKKLPPAPPVAKEDVDKKLGQPTYPDTPEIVHKL